MHHTHHTTIALIVAATLASGCSSPNSAPTRTELVVFAASSLTEAFQELERGFEEANPDVEVQMTFAGSQVLRLQIEQGAAVDLFAAADPGHMDALTTAGLVEEREAFASNSLVVIVPTDNPARIERFEDLSRASRLVIGTHTVPVGAYTAHLLERAEAELGEEFVANVRARVVSRESNARLVRAKVAIGEADAAIVYRTDAVGSEQVRAVSIPEELNVTASYPIGRLKGPNSPAAERFMAYLRSKAGRATLVSHGFK